MADFQGMARKIYAKERGPKKAAGANLTPSLLSETTLFNES